MLSLREILERRICLESSIAVNYKRNSVSPDLIEIVTDLCDLKFSNSDSS